MPNLFSNTSLSDAAPAQGLNSAQLRDDEGMDLVRLVSNRRSVTLSNLLAPSRSPEPIALSRQIAMYLMHIMLGRNLTQVGQFFARDRTTVAHACAKIEDMRDDHAFDQDIMWFEDRLAEMIEHRLRQLTMGAAVRVHHVH